MAGLINEIVIVSGKGGTGKTSITGALAAVVDRKVMSDCDVDAANLQLILGGEKIEAGPFESGWELVIDQSRCTKCNRCGELCRFGAIREGLVTAALLCEGCGVCADHCLEHAIHMKKRQAGEWSIWDTRYGPLVKADLGVAIENSGKLVSKVRETARRVAEKSGTSMIITDGPPGIGCPAIAAITGATVVLAVVEPTLSALHDLGRVNELTKYFRLPLCVCLNKCDLHEGIRQEVTGYCEKNKLSVVGEIPYQNEFRTALQENRVICVEADLALKNRLIGLWNNLQNEIRTI